MERRVKDARLLLIIGEIIVDWDKECVIDHLMTRITGPRKGGVDARVRKKTLTKYIFCILDNFLPFHPCRS